jgi:hypothetical protein
MPLSIHVDSSLLSDCGEFNCCCVVWPMIYFSKNRFFMSNLLAARRIECAGAPSAE